MWLALLACAGLAQEPAQDPATGTVVGRIEDVNGDHAAGDWIVELSGAGRKTIRVERELGEFRFEDVEPGKVRIYAHCKEYRCWVEEFVQVEAGQETFLVLKDDSRWVRVEVKDHRASFGERLVRPNVTLIDAQGIMHVGAFRSDRLFTHVGEPPFTVRIVGEGLHTVERTGVNLLDHLHLDVRGKGSLLFQPEDEATRSLLEGASFSLAWASMTYRHNPRWEPLGDEPLNLCPDNYSVRLRLSDGQELRIRDVEVLDDEPTILTLAIGEVAACHLRLPAGDERTEVWVEEVVRPDHVSIGAAKFEEDLHELRTKGTEVNLGSFPVGTELRLNLRWGPWFSEERTITVRPSVQTLEPGPMAFVEVKFDHDGSPLEGIFPALRSSRPGHVHHSRAQWSELHTREPVRPGRVAVGLVRDGAMIYLPEIEVADGEVARFSTIRVSEWIPTRCPLTVTVDGDVVTAGFSVSPALSAHVLDDQMILGVAPGEVDILLYDQQGTWLLRPKDLVLEPGDERSLQFEVTRTARRVRFLDRDGEPAARRRIAIKRAHPNNEAYVLTSRVKTDDDGWADVRYTPGTLTFSRLGREVTVDWPIETDTLTLK